MPPDPPLSISRWQGRSARNAHSAGSCSGRSTSTHRNRVYATACFCRAAVRASPRRTPPRAAAVEPRGRSRRRRSAGRAPAGGRAIRACRSRRRAGSARRSCGGRSRPCRPAAGCPAVSSTSPSDSACRSPRCSARWRSGSSSPQNTRPSCSRMRQRNPCGGAAGRAGARRPTEPRARSPGRPSVRVAGAFHAAAGCSAARQPARAAGWSCCSA